MRLLRVLDLGDLDLGGAVLFFDFAGHGDLLGGRAKVVVVVVLADRANQPVELGLVTFFDLQNVLTLVSLLECALEALAFAGHRDLFGCESGRRISEGRDDGQFESGFHDGFCVLQELSLNKDDRPSFGKSRFTR